MKTISKKLIFQCALLVAVIFGTMEIVHWSRNNTCVEVGKVMSMETRYYRAAQGCYIKTPAGWRDITTLHYMTPTL